MHAISKTLWALPRRQRRTSCTPAALESRLLLTGDVAAMFGDVIVAPTATSIDGAFGGIWLGEEMSIYGAIDYRPAAQTIHGVTGAVEPAVLFAQYNPTNDWYNGAIFDAVILESGQVVYSGESQGWTFDEFSGSFIADATYWYEPTTPNDPLPQFPHFYGLKEISANGDWLSVDSYGNIATTLWNVFGYGTGTSSDLAFDQSEDGQYAIGDRIWQRDEFGFFDAVDESSFEYTQTEGRPFMWGIEVAPDGTVIFAGSWFSTTTLTDYVSFWNLDGELLGTANFEIASFWGFEVIEGELFAAINGFSPGGDEAGHLLRMSDMAMISLESIVDPNDTIPSPIMFDNARRSMFAKDGRLGLILEMGSGPMVTVVETFEAPTVTIVESAVHQGNYAPNVLSMSTKTLQLALRGTATFDVTQLDRATLFVGDERNTVSGKITSIKFTDVNADGFRDAIIKVQTSSALRADTTQLKITGRTLTGDEFDGSRTVAMTAQSWQAHWQATSGSGWRTIFDAYKRGLKRTWW